MRVAATTAVVAGTATAVSGGMRGRQAGKAAQAEDAAAYQAMQQQAAMDEAAAQAVAAQQAQYAPAPVAPAAPAQDDTFAQLEKLAQMQQQGIITAEEFTAMKAKLLGL